MTQCTWFLYPICPFARQFDKTTDFGFKMSKCDMSIESVPWPVAWRQQFGMWLHRGMTVLTACFDHTDQKPKATPAA